MSKLGRGREGGTKEKNGIKDKNGTKEAKVRVAEALVFPIVTFRRDSWTMAKRLGNNLMLLSY